MDYRYESDFSQKSASSHSGADLPSVTDFCTEDKMLEVPAAAGITYAQVHLFFTIPLTIVLWFVVRPLIDTNTKISLIFTTTVALIYTTPWDNAMVWTNTWGFPDNAVITTIGYIPLEEYFFFVIQTCMVFLWGALCLRWAVPALYLPTTRFQANLVRWTPIPFFVAASVFCWTNYIRPETPLFYFRGLIGWCFPVICFLWFGAGNYIFKRFKAISVAIILPTVYLAVVDYLAIDAGVWHINPKAITGIYVIGQLPIEEALFFFAANVIIIFAYCALEKSMTVLQNYPDEFQEGNIIKKLFLAFVRLESNLDSERIVDLELTFDVLRKASKSFWAAGYIFPPGIRQDLSILYAFCRVTDDMVDDISLSKTEKSQKVILIRTLLDKVFKNREKSTETSVDTRDMDINARAQVPKINWNEYKDILSREELAAFRCLSRIAYQIPVEPLYELCLGYEWDIRRETVKSTDDLIQYSEYVAGSVGVLCTFVMANKSRDWFFNFPPKRLTAEADIIKHARLMGVSLQLTNVARDIVTDSETLARCYVPKDYLNAPQFQALLAAKPWDLGESTLRGLSLRILDLADSTKASAQQGIRMLPPTMWPGIVAATGVYTAIGKVVRKDTGYPTRASVSTFHKLMILLRALYFTEV